MFIAMNRFKVAPGKGPAFEEIWLSRDVHLHKVPGFVEFHLLRGPAGDDHILYSSHTIWQDKAAFEAWTKSEAFRLAHKKARPAGASDEPVYKDHPQYEGFEVIQNVGSDRTVVIA